MLKDERLVQPSQLPLRKKRKRPARPAARTGSQELKEILRDRVEEEHTEKRKHNKRRFASKKMRKLGSEHLSSERYAALGSKRNNTEGETLEQLVEALLKNSAVDDPVQLANDIRAAHKETTVACEKLDKIMSALFKAEKPIINYRGILQRSRKKQMGGSHLLVSLSNAMRNTIGYCEDQQNERRAFLDKYMALLVRVEALARSSVGGVRTNNAQNILKTSGAMIKPLNAPKEHATGARWAVRMGTGAIVELRSTAPARPVEGYLACSVARAGHMPEERAEGALYVTQTERAKIEARKKRRPVRALLKQQTQALCGPSAILALGVPEKHPPMAIDKSPTN